MPELQTNKALLDQLRQLLIQLPPAKHKAFIGFDGFIDTIQKPVRQRAPSGIQYFNTIPEFTHHLENLHGKSGQVELVTKRVKMGGNAPILANALNRLGMSCTCFGSMGFPELDPLFKSISTYMKMISVAAPGKSSAIEFDDGKIILSDLSGFKDYTWDYIKSSYSIDALKETVDSYRLIALVDWANLPQATNIWRGFLEDVVKPSVSKDRLFLFDLCDPSKKSPEQIKEILDLISQFSDYGKVTLGMNENEANKIASALRGHDAEKTEKKTVAALGQDIYNAMRIDTLLIHPIDRSLVFRKHSLENELSVIEMLGHVVKNPKVLTGGGDNLNAGYSLGLLAGFDIHMCMLLGMAASGAYVQNGESPGMRAITEYIEKWALKLGSLLTLDD
ncbi:MAG: hypothetical protein K2U26_15480 [Cyclobacteriaceae bacterium]|nr:hypothetical protein [Cyclobacteriaceae bacterium]